MGRNRFLYREYLKTLRYEDYYDEYEDEEYEDNEEDYSSSSIDENYSTDSFTKILPSEIASLSKNKTIVVWVGRQSCGYCTMYMPIVKDVAEEKNIPIYYIDIAYLTNEENNKLASSNSYLRKNQWGTPTTLLMLGNRVLDSIGGYVEKETFLSFLEDKVVMGE